ncbi:hypothetical protein K2173_005472 [Erythroxylum novogranatense]|uniref:HVA22-like protein n=1 Tax=Erythroxylum novogranatense TaxID=1862640 RepID=A0AAV8SKU8_9ROSI|nr:hypothetical protein K2173_005472 [Erythroxylum novogranatense]
MSRFWTLLSHLHSASGPVLMLLYPLYASAITMESPSREDDEQWLAYWIIYSFLTLSEMLLQSILEWIPIWYTVKLLTVGWLVLPQFRGAAYVYEKFVREHVRKYIGHHSSNGINVKGKSRFVKFTTPKDGEQEAY